MQLPSARAPPFRFGSARDSTRLRIVKDHPVCPVILSLRQLRPTLANSSGIYFPLDGMSATARVLFSNQSHRGRASAFPRCHIRLIIASTRSEHDRSTGPLLATSEPFEVPTEMESYRPMMSELTRKCELTFQSPYMISDNGAWPKPPGSPTTSPSRGRCNEACPVVSYNVKVGTPVNIWRSRKVGSRTCPMCQG